MDFMKTLRQLWLISLGIGAVSFVLGLVWVNSPGGPGFDWIWVVAAFGLGAVVYNVAFFTLCSIFVPSLSSRVEDDTEIRGDDVTHVVRHRDSGNEKVDFYIQAYAGARGTTAVAISVVVLGGLAWYFF